ncbi:hypothetical protein ES707_03416 [subsurface metagenome]
MVRSRDNTGNHTLLSVKACPYEWGYIFGVQYSDGHKPYKERYSLCVGLSGISREYLRLYLKAVKTVTDKSYSICFLPSHNQFSVKVWDRCLIDFIMSQGACGTWVWRVPNFIMNGEFELKRGFLNGFFDGDGYSSMRGKHVTLGFRSVNRAGVEDIKNILAGLGIHSEVFGQKCFDLIIYRLAAARQYFSRIGITLTSKRYKFESELKLRDAIVINRSWLPEEKSFLTRNYHKLPIAAIAKEMNRSESGVRYQARKLGIVRPLWIEGEEAFLLAHRREDRQGLARILGRSPNAVRLKLSRLLA